MTPETAQVMLALYQYVVEADLDPTDCVTAELVKTTENAYRDVQIAFANEVALICESVGSDVWRVRQLVNKSPYRQMHLPGAGVGGHCIPKDPWLLAHGVKDEDLTLRLIPTARAINDDMPRHMLALLADALESQGKSLSGSRVVVLGYAYLEDSDDDRNSPSKVLVTELEGAGAEVLVHDPYITAYQGDLEVLLRGADGVVLMVKHSQYLGLDPERILALLGTPVVVDGRGVFDKAAMSALGITYRGVGQGQL
jgi:UDP-N-acetyl-D-mannosaminuronic acid dehydrogenase